MSKSKVNRRAARGLGANGVPTKVPNNSVSITSPVLNSTQQNQVPAPAVASTPSMQGQSGDDGTPSVSAMAANGEQKVTPSSSKPVKVPTVSKATIVSEPLTNVPLGAHVNITYVTKVYEDDSVVEDEVLLRSMPGKTFTMASGTAHKEVVSSQQKGGRTNFKLAVPTEGIDKAALTIWLDWFRSVVVSPRYQGKKQIPVKEQWTVDQWAKLYAVTQWLDLKHPFSNSKLFGMLRAYLQDSDKPMTKSIMVEIWRATKPTDKQLRGLLVRRVVQHIEDIAQYAVEDEFEFQLIENFEAAMVEDLKDAYYHRWDEQQAYYQRQEERKRRRLQKQERVKQSAKERKTRLALEQEMHAVLANQRGVGTVPAKVAAVLRK